jgi:hypothetical protein
MPNCKKCGQTIVWNHQDHEETGKWRPFDEETDEPHNCPNNDWGQGSGGSSGGGGIDAVTAISIEASLVKLEDKMDNLSKNMLKIISEIQTLQMRIEGQMPLFSTNKVEAVEVDKPINASEIVALSEADEVGSGGKKNADISY